MRQVTDRGEMTEASVPLFYLYGEPRKIAEDRFVHVESLDDRTRPSEWTIRPHAHIDLNHIFHVQSGGGTLRADSEIFHFAAPCLLVIPAGAVHGFQWDRESHGSVMTLASSYFDQLVERDRDLASIFRQAGSAILPQEAGADVEQRLLRLGVELGWAAPGYRSAVEQDLLAVLVTVLRHMDVIGEGTQPGPQAALVARLRARIGDRFRLRETIETHARALGVSQRRLRDACAAIAHQSPGEMLDQRTMLEAKRSLIYGNLSIAELGYSLGFGDPAYFSRFFSRHAGESPGEYRRNARLGGS
ncbi:helix-turn-helix domain-containing protein [Sphingobium yanoikuyae]|uniref:helix-turn-helix domain-containing protein n=1 Tax=Sphingobium yanoikuyae TaxID=13690 RepID=UPI003B9EA6E6